MEIPEYFKKYFIPNEGNEYKPHALRKRALLFVSFLLLGIEALFLFQAFVLVPRVEYLGLVLSSAMVDETNFVRVGDGLPILKINPFLEAAAAAKARDMAEKGYFAHTSPEGLTPWYWFAKAGYEFFYAGENLAVNFTDSKDVVDAWMRSPKHRANIMNGDFVEIGIATAQGKYQGREAIFVVQLFGTPVARAAAMATLPSQPVVENIKLPSAQSVPAPHAVQEKTDTATEKETESPSDTGEIFAVAPSVEMAQTSTPATATRAVAVRMPLEFRVQSSVVAKTAATPRRTTNYLFYALGALIFLALFLNVLIEIKTQMAEPIVNAAVLLAAIGAMILLNQYLSLSRLAVL